MCYGERNNILGKYWPLWGLHFLVHIIMGLVGIFAGVIVIFTSGEFLNGAALVGAGSFALLNGWQGCKDLGKSKMNQLYRRES